jgi:hypothetical protein
MSLAPNDTNPWEEELQERERNSTQPDRPSNNEPGNEPKNKNSLASIFDKVNRRIEELNVQTQHVRAEFKQAQRLVDDVKRRMEELDNPHIKVLVEQDASISCFRIGARLGLLATRST